MAEGGELQILQKVLRERLKPHHKILQDRQRILVLDQGHVERPALLAIRLRPKQLIPSR